MDIDIDVKNNTELFAKLNVIRASLVKDNELKPHPCGVYFQYMAIDPITNVAAIPYDKAEDLGYFKIDLLNLGIYSKFESRDEIKQLLEIEPNWNLLSDREVVSSLFQINKHYDLINQIKPKSIIELAECLALIRPQKMHLVNLYMNNKQTALKYLWNQEDDGYAFKKAHAISYAMVIILQLHLLNH